MQPAVLIIFLLAALTPWLYNKHKARTPNLLALLPAALTLWFASHIPLIAGGEILVHEYAWIPGLDISLTMVLDGLSLMFALLICGIGTFIVLYAGSYLKNHQDLPRFLVVLQAFMASMLGLVLADNLITLFVFWELTSITSYLLIGFNHQNAEARKAALQGLIVTVGGGLALLAGLVMLASAGGSYSLQEIFNSDRVLTDHPLYIGMMICLLLGAFTKSAQFPFHFWLPNAMAAPTPVSAYLHSATMVKAGIYLMARLYPELGGTEFWINTLTSVGALTMLTGAFMAIRSTDLKKLLAYSTVMALGTLTLLLGLSTELALTAFSAYLLAHSLYKGALFMLAGIIDHETGTREVTHLGGLRTLMPITAICTLIAAFSLAGLPPMFGFVAKELLLESLLAGPVGAVILLMVHGGRRSAHRGLSLTLAWFQPAAAAVCRQSGAGLSAVPPVGQGAQRAAGIESDHQTWARSRLLCLHAGDRAAGRMADAYPAERFHAQLPAHHPADLRGRNRLHPVLPLSAALELGY